MFTSHCRIACTLFVLILCGGCEAEGPSSQTVSAGSLPPIRKIHGFSFSPYHRPGQDPTTGFQADREQVRELVGKLSRYASWIRFYGTSDDLYQGAIEAKAKGLNVVASAWIGPSPAADAENERQIARLVSLVNSGVADIATVGSEVLLRGDQTSNDLVAMIEKVRSKITQPVPVTTAETYGVLLAHPEVIDACDIVFFNVFGFWEGVALEDATCHFDSAYQQLLAASNGKPLVCSETGWPSQGLPFGDAIPSEENAAKYFAQFTSYADSKGLEYFYLEFVDQPWKTLEPGGVGPHWGVFDGDLCLKPGMSSGFWGNPQGVDLCPECPPTTPGSLPLLAVTQLPECGSTENLEGLACHLPGGDFSILVYIKVCGQYWGPKPSLANPLTPIIDGRFVTRIGSAGLDEYHEEVVILVVDSAFDPPAALGTSSVPAAAISAALLVETMARPCSCP